MDRPVHVTLLAVFVAVVALAGAVATAAAAVDGGDDARSRIGATATAAAAAAAGEAVVHRRRLASSIQDSVLNANKPACLRSCTAAGQPYTGRGCTNAYQCKG